MKHMQILIFFCCGSLIGGASDYYEGENRPYEFGFNLEGYQHRHEKKDENGIITGEFGFITADGVYHATVYATDENGNFKILSMKNIKIGLPGEQGTKPVPKELQPELPIRRLPKNQPKSNSSPVNLNPSNVRSCSGCSIPKPETGKQEDSRASSPKDKVSNDRIPSRKLSNGSGNELPGNNEFTSDDERNGLGGIEGTNPLFRPLSKSLISPASKLDPRNGQQSSYGDDSGDDEIEVRFGKPGNRAVVSKDESFEVGISKTGNAGNNKSFIPNRMAENSSGILYKFNYTVGYHGHHEQGDYDGDKDGGYHFVGRDGLRRVIDYQANEFGYQPHLVLENATANDIPQMETEKERGLQGYEFKWFNSNTL